MPSTDSETLINFREGADEGYIEIIGMGQSINETQAIAVNAKHTAGVPKSCSTVEQNFFRLDSAADLVGAQQTAALAGGPATRGVHNSTLTSNGATSGLNVYVDTPNVLKVSYFVRDEATGLEFGDNAVHVEDFASQPMITNQQLLGFFNGVFRYDPFNFELPNLMQGSYINSQGRYAAHNGLEGGASISSMDPFGQLYNDLRVALGATSIINDWSADSATQGDRTVTSQTDWVVTLPGQYNMTDPICALYGEFGPSACGATTTVEDDDLPVTLTSVFYDREEGSETQESGGLSVSPGGTGSSATELPNEVNVIVWSSSEVSSDGVLGSAAESNVDGETIKFDFDVTSSGFSNGWAKLAVSSDNAQPETFVVGQSLASGANVPPTTTAGKTQAYGSWVSVSTSVPIIGLTAWKRTFSDNANASYARAIEHSYES
jgi:hypothetical protein